MKTEMITIRRSVSIRIPQIIHSSNTDLYSELLSLSFLLCNNETNRLLFIP